MTDDTVRNLLNEIDLLSFLDELDINYETSGKNIGMGWVGINPCPNRDCQDTRNHFGINISTKAISCWVCGLSGTIIKFLMMHLDMDQDRVENLIRSHLEESDLIQDQDIETLVHKTFTHRHRVVEEPMVIKDVGRLPGKPITKDMLSERPKLSAFLRKRGIPLYLCKKFKFRYDYERSMRLIMPIHSAEGELIAYQGRDVTGRALLPYITQPPKAPIGKTLFNIGAWKKRVSAWTAIIVEGILDAIATMQMIKNHIDREKEFCVMACFRNKPTMDQMELLSDAVQIICMLDHDSWWNKREFDECLSNVGNIESVILPVGKDPSSLTDEEFEALNLPQYLS